MRRPIQLWPCTESRGCEGLVRKGGYCLPWTGMLDRALGERNVALDRTGLLAPLEPGEDGEETPGYLYPLPAGEDVEKCQRFLRRRVVRTYDHLGLPIHYSMPHDVSRGAFILAAVLEGYHGSRDPGDPCSVLFNMVLRSDVLLDNAFADFLCSLTNHDSEAVGHIAYMAHESPGYFRTPEQLERWWREDHDQSLCRIPRETIDALLTLWKHRQREDACDAMTEKP